MDNLTSPEVLGPLFVLGAAVVRLALGLIKGGAINKVPLKYRALVVLGLAALAAGLDALAGGGGLMSALTAGGAILLGLAGGDAIDVKGVQPKRAKRIRNGSITLGD